MQRRRISVTSALPSPSNPSPDFIQAGFDTAANFSDLTLQLTPEGKFFTTEFAERIVTENIEDTHLVITPVFYTGVDPNAPPNGDYFDACCLAYWQLPSRPGVDQPLLATLRGFSTTDFVDLTDIELNSIRSHLAAVTHTIKCPPRFLAVRSAKVSSVCPQRPAGDISASSVVEMSPAKKPRVSPPTDIEEESDPKGESPLDSSKPKFIPDLDGGLHRVLDTQNATKRRKEAQFMLRLLPPERHDDMGLGIDYKIDPVAYRNHVLELCIRDPELFSTNDQHWESTTGLQYLEACPAFKDESIWTRFCLGEWAWNTVYLLSLKSFHRTGRDYTLPLSTDISTLEFRMYLGECFEGLELFLRAVCSDIYLGAFSGVKESLCNPKNNLKGISDTYLFYVWNSWMGRICKELRTSPRSDGSLSGPAKCREFIIAQIASTCTMLDKVAQGDLKSEKTFATLQLPQLQFTGPTPSQQEKPGTAVTGADTPSNRRTTRGTNALVTPAADPVEPEYTNLCFFNIAEQLDLKYPNNKNPVVCKRARDCVRNHVKLSDLDTVQAIAALPKARISTALRKAIKTALEK